MRSPLSGAAWLRRLRLRPRRLFIHAGLHKTGTTAVQEAFSEHAALLRAHGLLYPATGRHELLHGQHNLAWQLAADRRFEPARGGVDETAREIAAFDGDAVLSSEDFETVLADRAGLRPLLQHRALRRHRTVLVVYLRPQADYAESLYAEMLDHGMANDAGPFCETLLTQGRIGFRDWVFHFDYAALGAAGYRRVLWRPYRDRIGGSAVTDLLHVMGRGDVVLPAPDADRNRRDTLLDSLARFCAHRLGLEVAETEERLAALLGAGLDGCVAALSAARRRAIRDRFAGGNGMVARAGGFAEAALQAPTAPPAGSLDMEALFSSRVLDVLQAGLDGAQDAEAVIAALRGG